METNTDEENNTSPAIPEPAPHTAETAAAEPASDAVEPPTFEGEPEGDAGPEAAIEAGDELVQLADAAVKARLAQEDEERLTALLKEALLGGRGGVARAVAVLPRVPWIVGVRAVEQVWAELSTGFRTQLFSSLAKDESDAARRIRLSLARALFKVDVPTAMKIALGVLKDLRDKNSGELTARNAQIISNVFIGRGKPWLAQLPLAELKPAEVDLLVHCATLAAFMVPHPPVTQLGVLKWAQEAGRLDKLQEPTLSAVLRGIARWNVKWQGALRKEIEGLPEALAAVLKPAPAEGSAETAPESPEASDDDDDEEDDEEPAPTEDAAEPGAEGQETPRKERPVYEPRPQRPRDPAETREREPQRERPVYTPRNAGPAARNFNLNEALKAIESHVQSLRQELAVTQQKLRQKDDDRRARRQERSGPIIEGEPTPEELARLNLQLESRNQELQARIEELMQNSEDMAASSGAISGEPVTDTGAQLRTLLALKLQEDYADFMALEKDSHDFVVSQHYPTILRHIFEVLRGVEVPFTVPEIEAT